MDHHKPLPLSQDQMEEVFRLEKSADDIVRETSERLREEVREILGGRKPAAKTKT
jgi:hypothetical protein